MMLPYTGSSCGFGPTATQYVAVTEVGRLGSLLCQRGALHSCRELVILLLKTEHQKAGPLFLHIGNGVDRGDFYNKRCTRRKPWLIAQIRIY